MATTLNNIIIVSKDGIVESPYRFFTILCEKKGWNWQTLKSRKFPFKYRGFKIEKMKIVSE